MSKLLLNGEGFEIDRNLAAEIGLEEAIVYTYVMNNAKNGFIIKDNLYNNLIMFSKKTIDRYLNKLSKLNLVRIGLNPAEKYSLISGKNLKGHGIGENVCEWCGISTLITHSHHYPIQKKDNGTETVNICPTCHYEFHIMDTAIILKAGEQ